MAETPRIPAHHRRTASHASDYFQETRLELLAGASRGDLDAIVGRYQVLRRARTRKIQRSSQVTNDLLHLPDGPALAERDRRMSRILEDFGWIHEFDALRAVSESNWVTNAADAAQ